MNAVMPDGRTIEMHYQCDLKFYEPGGRLWQLGKGKPPLLPITREDLWKGYIGLWRIWTSNNMDLMRELFRHARNRGNTLSDKFATTDINQARALAEILTELSAKGKP